MPSLTLLGKRTVFGGDDLRCCVTWYGLLRLIQCACIFPLIALTIVGNVHNDDYSKGNTNMECNDSLLANGRFGILYVYFWASLIYTLLVWGVLETRLWIVSGWGTPTLPGKRSSQVKRILYWKYGLAWPAVTLLAMYGMVMWHAAHQYCQDLPLVDSSCRQHRDYCQARLTHAWTTLLHILVSTHIAEALLGGALLASIFSQHVLPILSYKKNHKQNQSSDTVCGCFTRTCCIRWMLWCCCSWTSICVGCLTGQRTEAPTEGDFGTLAALLNDFIGNTQLLDIVPSDIVASLTVLRRLQRQRRLACQQAIQQQQQQPTEAHTTDGRQLLLSTQNTNTRLPDETSDVVPEHGRGTLQSTRSVASFVKLERHTTHKKNDSSTLPMDDDETGIPVKQNNNNDTSIPTNHDNNTSDPESFDQRYRVSAVLATRVLLEPTNAIDALAMAEGARFMKLALSIYSWLMQMMQHPIQECWNVFAVGSVCHLVKGKCCANQRRTNDDSTDHTIVGDWPCGWHENSFLHRSGWKETDLVYAQFQGGVAKTPYAIVVDHDWKSVVVVIRGTLSVDDLMADLAVQPASLAEWGNKCGFDGRASYAHKGILDCAVWVYNDLQRHGVLERLLLDDDKAHYKDYSLRIVGHSLGAGIASIVGLFLRNRFPQNNLRCSCFCPPGCTISSDLAEECSDFTTSYVLDSDFVPRLSLQVSDQRISCAVFKGCAKA